eukprot:g6421.t1
MKVLGSRIIPRSLVDTAHLSILNHCAQEDGVVVSITLRLGATPPGDGTDWEARVYEKAGPRDFVLKSRSRLQVNIRSLEEQEITLSKPLDIKKGQYVGLTNRSGRLSVTYTRGWTTETSATRDFWDLWYQEIQPSAEINSQLSAMLLWNGRVGWYASMREDPPEPVIERVKSTMSFDIGQLWHDKDSTDVIFEVGPQQVEVRAHKIILKARSRYFAALLAGGFAESDKNTKRIVMPSISPEAFSKVLEWLYTDTVTEVHSDIAVEVLQAGSRYCLDGLIAETELILKEYVDLQNLGEMYQLAQITNANQLLDYCIYFAKKHVENLIRFSSVENASLLLDLARMNSMRRLQETCEKILRVRSMTGSHSNKLEPLIYHQSLEAQQLNCAHKKDSRRGSRSPRVRNMKSTGLKTRHISEVHTSGAMDSPAETCHKKNLHSDRKSNNGDIQEEEKAEPKEEKLGANITQTAGPKEEKLDANITHTANNSSPARLKSLKSIEPPDETLHPDNVREEVVGRDRLWSG